jgi:hypothetical protein
MREGTRVFLERFEVQYLTDANMSILAAIVIAMLLILWAFERKRKRQFQNALWILWLEGKDMLYILSSVKGRRPGIIPKLELRHCVLAIFFIFCVGGCIYFSYWRMGWSGWATVVIAYIGAVIALMLAACFMHIFRCQRY